MNGGVDSLNRVVLLKAEQTSSITSPGGQAMAEYGRHGKEEITKEKKNMSVPLQRDAPRVVDQMEKTVMPR